MEKQKAAWLKWLEKYGTDNFLDMFLYNVEGAQSRCKYCGEFIYVDVLIGGGVPDWSTEDGDFGCWASPDTNDDGVGGHMPFKRSVVL